MSEGKSVVAEVLRTEAARRLVLIRQLEAEVHELTEAADRAEERRPFTWHTSPRAMDVNAPNTRPHLVAEDPYIVNPAESADFDEGRGDPDEQWTETLPPTAVVETRPRAFGPRDDGLPRVQHVSPDAMPRPN